MNPYLELGDFLAARLADNVKVAVSLENNVIFSIVYIHLGNMRSVS